MAVNINSDNYFENYMKNYFPSLLTCGKSLVSVSQQLEYQKATRLNGCIPQGIAGQSKIRYSVNKSPFQNQLQQLYYFTAHVHKFSAWPKKLFNLCFPYRDRVTPAGSAYLIVPPNPAPPPFPNC